MVGYLLTLKSNYMTPVIISECERPDLLPGVYLNYNKN